MARLLGLLVLLFLVPQAAAQGNAAVTPDPFVWDDHATPYAQFEVAIAAASTQRALTIRGIRIDPEPRRPDGEAAAVPMFYAPTPTLVLPPGTAGKFHVWVGGFGQAGPHGPTAGDYRVNLTIEDTLHPGPWPPVTALLRRIHVAEPADATIQGRVTDASNGGLPAPQGGPVVVHIGDPGTARILAASDEEHVLDAQGRFRFDVPPGAYWLRVDAPGYRSTFIGPLDLASGATTDVDLALAPDALPPVVTGPQHKGDAGLPTYRLATSLGLERAATTSGRYTPTAGQPAESLSVFAGSGARLWQKALPAPQAPPFDAGLWDSADHGLDVNADGTLFAVGTSGGTIEVYDDQGALRWSHTTEATPNSRVPGPLGEGIRRSSEVRFSDDGEFLAAGTLTGLVLHFNATTGARVWRFETAAQVRALRYDANATRLFVVSADGHLYGLDAKTGAEAWRADLTFWAEHVAMTQDARRIAVGGKDGTLHVFDQDGRTLWSREFPGAVLGFDYENSGAHLVVVAQNGVYDYDRDGRLRWFRHEHDNAGQLRVGAGGRFLGYGRTTTGADGATARVLSVNGTPVWEFRAGPAPETIHNVRFLEDGSRLLANGEQGKVYAFANWLEPRSAASPAPSAPSDTWPTPHGDPGPGALLSAFAVVAALGFRARRRRPRAVDV